jgi:DNA-binding transcriptional LysR family regulator
VAELVGLQRGRVRVGATPSLCIGVLADVLRVFHERYPAIHLELAENGSQLLVSSLLRNEIDIALVIVPAEGLDAGCASHPCCGSDCPWPLRRRGRRRRAGGR